MHACINLTIILELYCCSYLSLELAFIFRSLFFLHGLSFLDWVHIPRTSRVLS